MGVIVFAEQNLAGIALMGTNSIMKLAMNYVGMEETLVNMNVMTGIEFHLTDVTSIVCKNNKELKLLEEAHSFL